MPSTLTTRGSTRQWRKLREPWQTLLEQNGSLPCWRCSRPILAGQPWCLGHLTDRALGGTDQHLHPEHKHCSDTSGGQLGAKLRTARSTESACAL